MPFLLARLQRLLSTTRRYMFYRGTVHEDDVSEEVASLAEGEVVLLWGSSPPWRKANIVQTLPWPDLKHPRELWETRERSMEVVVQQTLSSFGAWHVDPRGVPCEIGIGARTSNIKYVVNYAGWRIADFPPIALRVWECPLPVGMLWLVPPDSVPESVLQDESPPPRRPLRLRNESLPERRPPPPLTFLSAETQHNARPRPEPQPEHVDERVPYRNLHFADHRVVVTLGQAYGVEMESSRGIYSALIDQLAAENPEGPRVVGNIWPSGAHNLEIPELETVFAKLEYHTFVHQAARKRRWLDGNQLTSMAGCPATKLDELLLHPELGLTNRVEAFRLLFSLRDPSLSVQILPGDDVVVPVAAEDGGPHWYLWEKVETNHATYLFRPQDEETRKRMLGWIGLDKRGKRANLLVTPSLQRSIGFEKRAIHKGIETDLAGWWRDICQALGRSH